MLASAPALAQKKNGEYQLRIHRASTPIIVDGSAHEPAWESAEVAGNFWRVLPMDTGHALTHVSIEHPRAVGRCEEGAWARRNRPAKPPQLKMDY